MEMENTLRNCVVVEDDEVSTDVIGVGNTVKVKNLTMKIDQTITIVGANETDPKNMKISSESPIARRSWQAQGRDRRRGGSRRRDEAQGAGNQPVTHKHTKGEGFMDTQAAVPQQLSEQEGIRREKLRKLRQAGQDPYAITRFDRTHESTDILGSSTRWRARRSAWRGA